MAEAQSVVLELHCREHDDDDLEIVEQECFRGAPPPDVWYGWIDLRPGIDIGVKAPPESILHRRILLWAEYRAWVEHAVVGTERQEHLDRSARQAVAILAEVADAIDQAQEEQGPRHGMSGAAAETVVEVEALAEELDEALRNARSEAGSLARDGRDVPRPARSAGTAYPPDEAPTSDLDVPTAQDRLGRQDEDGRLLVEEVLIGIPAEPDRLGLTSMVEVIGEVVDEFGMLHPGQRPDPGKVLALLDHVTREEIEATGAYGLVELAVLEIVNARAERRPVNPAAVAPYTSMTSHERELDQLIGDCFEIPSDAFFDAIPEAREVAERALAHRDEPAGPDPHHGSLAYEAAMDELARLHQEKGSVETYRDVVQRALDTAERNLGLNPHQRGGPSSGLGHEPGDDAYSRTISDDRGLDL